MGWLDGGEQRLVGLLGGPGPAASPGTRGTVDLKVSVARGGWEKGVICAIHGLYWDNDDRFKPSTF